MQVGQKSHKAEAWTYTGRSRKQNVRQIGRVAVIEMGHYRAESSSCMWE